MSLFTFTFRSITVLLLCCVLLATEGCFLDQSNGITGPTTHVTPQALLPGMAVLEGHIETDGAGDLRKFQWFSYCTSVYPTMGLFVSATESEFRATIWSIVFPSESFAGRRVTLTFWRNDYNGVRPAQPDGLYDGTLLNEAGTLFIDTGSLLLACDTPVGCDETAGDPTACDTYEYSPWVPSGAEPLSYAVNGSTVTITLPNTPDPSMQLFFLPGAFLEGRSVPKIERLPRLSPLGSPTTDQQLDKVEVGLDWK